MHIRIKTSGIISAFVFLFFSVVLGEHGRGGSGDESLKKLTEGNSRFVSGKIEAKDISDAKRKELLSKGQHPFVTIVSCSDSRVPLEILFDQGMGDIFVIRAAGNVVDDVGLGSVEYGVEHVGTPLLVILGHQDCGAVKATLAATEKPAGSIGAIVQKIKPAVDKAKASGKKTEDELMELATRLNLKNVYHSMLQRSTVIRERVHEKKLKIVLGEYYLDSGKVEFFEEVK